VGDLFVGWNLLSDRARSAAFKKSLENGQPTATDAYLLSGGDAAVEIIVSIYPGGKAGQQGPLTAVIGIVVDLTTMLGRVEDRSKFVTTLNTRFNSTENPRVVYRSQD